MGAATVDGSGGGSEPSPGASPPAACVGRAIRDLRRAVGLSLSELARRSGVGKATLSQLEAGARNPTLDTLFALVDVLGVPLGTVLQAAGNAVTSGVAVDAMLVDRHVAPARIAETFRLDVRPVRQVSPPHVAGTTETLVVVSGRVRVGPVTDPRELGPGEGLTFAADVPHGYEAVAEPATCLLVMTVPRAGRER
jgi:transcriptional regulator with XRE-family HTH domain